MGIRSILQITGMNDIIEMVVVVPKPPVRRSMVAAMKGRSGFISTVSSPCGNPIEG